MELEKIILDQFNELNRKVRTANFYKVDLHIHTPGSKKDYRVNGRQYEKVSIEVLEDIATQKGLYEKPKFRGLYNSKDELMALLIVHEAYNEKDLNLIAITDHDNMSWFKLIIDASIKYRCNIAKIPKKFEILPGVEITCFNGTHIIAIFDYENYNKTWEYVKYDLNGLGEAGHKIFTFKSEMDVVKTIRRANGIVYIPHLDNNAQKTKIKDMLTPLNGVSKVELLISNYVDAIGFTNYEYKDIVRETLECKNSIYFRKTPVAYIKDSDAHSIEEIGKNFIYIKMDRPCFNSLKFALKDPLNRVRENLMEKSEIPYIRGIVIKGGYLSKLNTEFTYYPFSKSLNCIIGKNSSGKSTIIKCLMSCIKGEVIEEKFNNFMANFKILLIYIRKEGKDYCILYKPIEEKSEGDSINVTNIKDIKKWTNIYIIKDNHLDILDENTKIKLIREFQIVYFNQGEIMEIIKDEKLINQFIENIILNSNMGEYFTRLKDEIAHHCLNGIYEEKNQKNIKKISEERDRIIFKIMDQLNINLEDKVIISYNGYENGSYNIMFNVNSNDPKQSKVIFKNLEELSLGQRTMAIMTIITKGITRLNPHIPLIIDQPEDQLDNKFIYEELVESIRNLKEEKQIIIVTQDSNIPVNGDAENIMCMASNYERCWMELYGSLDNNKIKGKIMDTLEGGQESFKIRMSKYNLI